MKKWKRILSRIPRKLREQYGYAVHMRERPSGMPRETWTALWLEQHAAHWSLADRVATGKFDLPRVEFPPKPSPRVWHRTRKVYAQTVVRRDDFLQSYEWRQLRMKVLTKRGARCECCGASPKDGVTIINVDHIKPRRDFPELALVESNLQVLCDACNHGKGNWDQTDWRTPAVQPVELPPNWNDPLWTKPH